MNKFDKIKIMLKLLRFLWLLWFNSFFIKREYGTNIFPIFKKEQSEDSVMTFSSSHN